MRTPAGRGRRQRSRPAACDGPSIAPEVRPSSSTHAPAARRPCPPTPAGPRRAQVQPRGDRHRAGTRA